ncbi:MAG: alpha/beta fold hydrolase [Chloroflexia bacterium]
MRTNSILTYEERGEGVPIVLLHGFPFDHSIWQAQLDGLGEGVRVLTPDLPGFGGSAPLPGEEPTMDDYADRVAQWAEEIGLGRFALVGHSMGGYIAFAFVRKYASMLSGLALVCTRPGADTEQGRQGRYTQIAGVLDRGPVVVVEAMLPKLFAPQTRESNPGLVEQVRDLMMRQPVPGIVSALRAMASRPDSTPMLENISVPTLVISGAEDAIIPAPDADLMASTIPGAKQEKIEAAGHLPMMEQPDSLNEALRSLTRSVASNR